MDIELFETHRNYLFAIAYRMLGSVMEAEDMVQETFVRLQGRVADKAIEAPKAFLAKTITRLCLDHLKSARVLREQYIGTWLPEPLVTSDLPEVVTAHRDSLSVAYLMMLEHLSPEERAIYILREAFDFDYKSLAVVVDKKEPACRQLFSRAKKRMSHLPTERRLERSEKEKLIGRFVEAWFKQDIDQIVSLLTEDVVQYSDGGGQVHAATKPIEGRDHVTRFLTGILRLAPDNLELKFEELNGDVALLVIQARQPLVTYQVLFQNRQIHRIYAVLNPSKLKQLQR